MKKNIFLKSIKDDHADGYRSGSGLIRSILGDLELPSQKNHTFITIWKSWFSYEFPLVKNSARTAELFILPPQIGLLRKNTFLGYEAAISVPQFDVFFRYEPIFAR